MNYEKIIIELLSRIQAIEEKIGISPVSDDAESIEIKIKPNQKNKKLSTAEIKAHIIARLEKERQSGKEYAELICGVIHKELGLKNAVPMVCNAMKASMNPGDTFIFRSPSGYSATLKIRYNLIKKAIRPETRAEIKTEINEIKQIIRQEAKPEANEIKPIIRQEIKPETNEIKPIIRPEIKPEANEIRQIIRSEIKQEPEKKPEPVKPVVLEAAEVWQRILKYEWAIFYLPDGGEFAYIAGNDYLAIVRTNYRLPRADIEKALTLFPFKNAVPLQHLRYPSYIYSILTDERIIGR